MTVTSTMHDCYPLAVKAEATLDSQSGAKDGSAALGSTNSNITQAVFEKDKVESDFDGNDLGKKCVICLSEPRNTTVLPCRHMPSDVASGPILPMDAKRSRDDNDPNDIL
ncbi:putative trypsin inhibitor 1-like [Capsicum annuum]|nr:putative trypsin inhibitor 1-like [Capsicum annuum]